MKNIALGRTTIPLLAATLVSGCIARTAASVVTAPVRVVSKGVDLAITSQSEADEKRGRDMRHHEQRLEDLDRQYRSNSQRCSSGRQDACQRAQRDYDDIQRLSGVPARR